MRVAIVGGGAAGFFSAIHVKENYPNAAVVILEKSKKVLAKVKISGGGRCNVTNGCTDIKTLSAAYPRGARQLRKAFGVFNTKHTMEWFEQRNVPLVIQADNCVFPASQNSQTIIDCFQREVDRLGIKVITECPVNKLIPIAETGDLQLGFARDIGLDPLFNHVIITTGGSPKRSGLNWLEEIGHTIENPVPSLFTFNMPNEAVKELMGVVVIENKTHIQGTKLKSDGPLLITHWGMSGPSILKLSAFGARDLANKSYEFKLQVNWCNMHSYNDLVVFLNAFSKKHPHKKTTGVRPFAIPDRLWRYLVDKAGISDEKRWSELGKKGMNKLVEVLMNDSYEVKGKTTFKEEFVTCGGVSLTSIDIKTMQSKVVKNLYFAGEVLDIDGITGGYNFQAAWTTAFIAAKLN